MKDGWIVIPGWKEFQHADAVRTKVMPWIKDATQQLSKDEYLGLTFAQRGLLQDLRREYARSQCELSASPTRLSRRLGQQVTRRMLEALNQAGFIAFSASKPASNPASKPASLEEKRLEPPLTPPTGGQPPQPESVKAPRRQRGINAPIQCRPLTPDDIARAEAVNAATARELGLKLEEVAA